VSLAGDHHEARVALVEFLVASGHPDRAEAEIRETERAISGERTWIALARCYELVGHTDQAEALYRTMLSKSPDDAAALRGLAYLEFQSGHIQNAEDHLRKVLGVSGRTPDEEASARGLLSLVLAAGGEFEQSREILTKAEVPSTPGTGSQPSDVAETAEDIRSKARVLAIPGSRRERREAIRLLEALARREPLLPEDHFLLAQLFEKEGEPQKAHGQMELALALDGKNPRLLVYHARDLVRHGELDQAQHWLARLEVVKPGDLGTMEIKARLLSAGGHGKAAVGLLEAYVNDHHELARPVAVILEQINQPTAAEGMYRRFASLSRQSGSTLVLAEFLGRQRRTEEALDLCESARSSSPPDVVTSIGLNAVLLAPDNKTQIERVNRWLEEATRTESRKTTLLVNLAILRALQGRYDESERLYRQVLAQDPRNVMALNNLAWLLALKSGGGGSDAEALADRAIGIAGPIPALQDTRALARLANGRHDQAISDLEDVLSSTATPAIYVHLAYAYARAKRHDDAARTVQKVSALGLKAERLHPLDRVVYRQLITDLAQK
jgi:tetratricopeptide (TPR) repeat protein